MDVEAALAALAAPDHVPRLRAQAALLAAAREDAAFADALLLAGLLDARPNAAACCARIAAALRHAPSRRRLEALCADHRAPLRARKAAAQALGWLGEPASAASLQALLTHPNAMARRAALEALGRVGGERALAALRAALGERSWALRQEAVLGLGGLGDAALEAIDALTEALRGESHGPTAEQCLRQIAALGQAHGEARDAALAALRGALEAPSPLPDAERWRLRRAVARGLGELGDRASLARVAALRADPSWAVAESADWAWRALTVPSRGELG
jgi:HEAT repeat protein